MAVYSIIEKSKLEGAHRLDAEYYQPEYLNLQSKLKRLHPVNLDSLALITDGIHSSIDYDANSKIRCLSAQSVKENYFDLSGNVFISEEQHRKNPRTALKSGDIILSSVGTIGNCAVVTEKVLPSNADRHVAIIRLRKPSISPFYIAAFLNSRYGVFQSVREATGNVQLNLFIDKIEKMQVPLLAEHKKIGELAKLGKETLLKSDLLCSQAENLLLEELGLKNFKPEEELSCAVSLSDIKLNHRMDAEYFQPKYKRIIEKVKKHKLELLGDLVSMKKGFEPGSEEYQDNGKFFIRVSNISKHGLTDKDQKFISELLYQELKRNFKPNVGEILLTKDANPGIAYVLKEEIDGIIASGIMRLSLKKDIEPEYLALCINSLVGQMQIERDAGGSIIVHWKPEQIKQLKIPILPHSIQQKIADLIHKSHEARKKAKELLEEAKRKVEAMIERGSQG